MPNPREFHFRLPAYSGPPLPEPPHAWYPGALPCAPHCTSDRLLRSDGRIHAFVIHATAGGSSSGAMSVLLDGRASWHWLIPGPTEPAHGSHVWACAPERRAAWHVRNDRCHPDINGGRDGVNYWSLGLEIVNPQKGEAFSDWQVEQAAALVRYAWSKYPDLVHVVSHAKLDSDRRSDPGLAFPWERFQELVLARQATSVAELADQRTAIRILAPNGRVIACDARSLDGVTVVEARPLIEALGFSVRYEKGRQRTMRIVPPPAPQRTRRPGRKRPRSKSPAARGQRARVARSRRPAR